MRDPRRLLRRRPLAARLATRAEKKKDAPLAPPQRALLDARHVSFADESARDEAEPPRAAADASACCRSSGAPEPALCAFLCVDVDTLRGAAEAAATASDAEAAAAGDKQGGDSAAGEKDVVSLFVQRLFPSLPLPWAAPSAAADR